MKRFSPAAEPLDFAERVRVPGANWLSLNPGVRRPRDYWSPFRHALADAFENLCAYSVMWIPEGTVDHFVSWNEDNASAYEWSNYRYCAGWINSSKQNLHSRQLIDPFEVEDGWFEILLPSLQLVASKSVPPEQLDRVTLMLRRMNLGHDERIMRPRRQWYAMYQEGKLSLQGLREKAPLIADAVIRQARQIE